MAAEYAKVIAELPLNLQIAIMRRRKDLSQEKVSRRIRKPQSVVARLEGKDANPRLSTLEAAAKGLDCLLMLIPKKKAAQVAEVVCRDGIR